jgi:ABC-type sugar transport system ATPase subunit
MTAEPVPGAGATASADPSGDVLRVEHINKRFGAVTALNDVNLHLVQGEVLGLLGDNGAGKSTLIKIMCGFQPPTSGRIILEGREITLKSVDDARSLGIDTVYQDLALINELTVYHNMFLNRERTRFSLLANRSMRRTAQEQLDRIGVDIPSVDAQVAKLSGGQRQAIAVARAMRQGENIKILMLDEPLAAMGAKETSLIIDMVRGLIRQTSVSVIVIDHNYTHLFELCDRINVIQQGRVTIDRNISEMTLEELIEMMVQSYRRQIGSASGASASRGS